MGRLNLDPEVTAAPSVHHLDWSRSRRALKVAVSTGCGNEVVEVEVPVGDLLALLASAGGDPLMPRYLLFAGPDDRPAGGVRDLVGSYGEEDAAKAAFRRVRRRLADDGAWAELVAVDSMNRCRPVCWYGRAWHPWRASTSAPARATPRPADAPPPRPPPAGAPRRSLRRRLRRALTSPRSQARP